MASEHDLSSWVRSNMTVDDSSIMMTHKESVSRLVSLSNDGKVILLKDRKLFSSRQLVVLYLLGKLFAKVANYSTSRAAVNSEIAYELGVPKGTVGRCLMELREMGHVRPSQDEGNELLPSAIPAVLEELLLAGNSDGKDTTTRD